MAYRFGDKAIRFKKDWLVKLKLMTDYQGWGAFTSSVLSDIIVDAHPEYTPEHRPVLFVKEATSKDIASLKLGERDPWGTVIWARVPGDAYALNPRCWASCEPQDDFAHAYRIRMYPGSYRLGEPPPPAPPDLPSSGLGKTPIDPRWNHAGRYRILSKTSLHVPHSLTRALTGYLRRRGDKTTYHRCKHCAKVLDPVTFPRHVCDKCGGSFDRGEWDWDHHPVTHKTLVEGALDRLTAAERARILTPGQPNKLTPESEALQYYNKYSIVRPLCKQCHRAQAGALKLEKIIGAVKPESRHK